MKHHMRFIAQIYPKDQFTMAYLEKAFEMDFEKVYDTIDRHGFLDEKSVWNWRKTDESSDAAGAAEYEWWQV